MLYRWLVSEQQATSMYCIGKMQDVCVKAGDAGFKT
jgi:hypothetical protein